MLVLRPYQERSSKVIRQALTRHKRVILCLPTGSGKTATAIDFVLRAVKKGLRPVFLADREELVDQTIQALQAYGLSVEALYADTSALYKCDVYVAMVETFFRRCSSGWFDLPVDLLILDECHISNYFKVVELDKFKHTMVIGLTATPVSANTNYQLNKYYQILIMETNVEELINDGFLAPAVEIGNNELLDLKVVAGEFSARSQIDEFNGRNMDKKMLTAWQHHCLGRQTIVYNISIEHNQRVNFMFTQAGVTCAAVDKDTPKKERKEIIQAYKAGEIQVLNNVGVLTKGFDSPSTSCIVLNKSTSSVSLYYQMVGRGARIYPGKNNFIVLDMGNNILRHGSYNTDVDWKYLFDNDSRDKNFTVKKNVKLCPNCYAYIFNQFTKECHVCHRYFVPHELISLESLMPPGLLDKPVEAMTLKELQTFGKFKGYRPGWSWYQFQKRTNNRVY